MLRLSINQSITIDVEPAEMFCIQQVKTRIDIINDHHYEIKQINALEDKSTYIDALSKAVNTYFEDASPSALIQGGLLAMDTASFDEYTKKTSKKILTKTAKEGQTRFANKYENQQQDFLKTVMMSTDVGKYFCEVQTMETEPTNNTHKTVQYSHRTSLSTRIIPHNDPVKQQVEKDAVGLESRKEERKPNYIARHSTNVSNDLNNLYIQHTQEEIMPQRMQGYNRIQNILKGII